MKKPLLLLLAFALASLFAQAQDYSCDSLFLEIKHPTGSPYFDFLQSRSILTNDGNVLTCIATKTMLNHRIVDFGDWLYMTDPQSMTVLDSVFVETNYAFVEDNIRPLFANAPDGEGYILAKLIHNRVSYSGYPGNTWLRISRIDNALNVQAHEDAIIVPLEDFAVNRLIGITLEGDCIVLSYLTDARTPVMARIGLDGTIKDKVAIDNLFMLDDVAHGLAVYNDTPREYSLCDWTASENDTCLVYHVFDSLFTMEETIVLEGHWGDFYPVQPGQFASSPMPLDDGTFVHGFMYERHNLTRNGVSLQKYDKITHECLVNIQFESWPIYADPDRMGYPIGMITTVNDNIYFAYRTNNNVMGTGASTKGWLCIAKLDKDLNVLWQRYCLGSPFSTGGYLHNYCHISKIEDGFSILGKCHKDGESYNFFYYFVHDADPYGISEAEAFIRPYMFYPNPTQNELYLQYSPDVKPKQIELYDLQGRLVRSQSKGLESLNMAGLPAGTYTMRVMLEDGKAFTDKVVKE